MDRKKTQHKLNEDGDLEPLIKEVIEPVKLSDEDIACHWQKIMKEIGDTDSAPLKIE